MNAVPNPALRTLTTAPMARRERRPMSLRGFLVLEDGTSAEILVLDLSYEGCGIETPIELAPGQAVTLSVLRRGAILAFVRWSSGGNAGLVFKPEEPEAKRQQHPRSSERTALSAEVVIRRLGKANFRVRVFDLSPQGCKVELIELPGIGEHVLVKFAGLEVLEAEVCWVESNCAGVRFEKVIHPAVFDLMVERMKG